MATRTLNVAITGDARSLNRVLDQTESRSKRWGSSMAKGFAVAGAAAAGGLAVGLKKSAEAAIESEKSQARMVTQLKASGMSWRQHRDQIDEVIQKHSQLSGLDDEDLQDAFTNIVRVTGDVDKSLRLTGLAADFARAKHMDVAKAGELVGKVAGGNTGILSRYGIQVEKGATAQEALATLQAKFAGQAESYGKTTAGSLDRASVASENLSEIVGSKLTPWLAKAATALVNVVDKAGQLAGPIRRASGVVVDRAQAMVAAVRRFANRNREDIDAVIESVRRVGRFFKSVFEDVIVPAVRAALPGIKRALLGILEAIRGMVRLVTGVINGDWKRAWGGVKDIVKGAFKALSGIIKASSDALGSVMLSLGKYLVRQIGKGLGALGSVVKDKVVDGVTWGIDQAGKVVPGLSISKKLLEKIGDGVGRGAVRALPSTGAGLDGADADLMPFARIGASAGLRVSSGIRPGDTTLSGNVSYHSSGDAIDMAGPMAGMRRAAVAIRRMFGPRLRELISPFPELGIKDGKPFRYSAGIQAQHSGANAHVHVAYTGPFGDGIGQAASAARAAGFRGDDLLTAIAIAGPESGYRNSARLVTAAEDSRGMWQINTYAHPWARGLNLRDPNVAARAAYRVYRQAGGFGPWTAYTAGTYRSYLDDAQRALGAGGGGGGNSRSGGGQRRMSPAEQAYRQSIGNAKVRQGVAIRNARRSRPLPQRSTGPGKGFAPGEHPAGVDGDPNQPLIDALNRAAELEQQRLAAVEEQTAAIRDANAQMKRQSDLAQQWSTTSEFQLKKYLADILSGQFGRGIVGRVRTPGIGAEVAY